jgi:hypothetical protein
MRKCGKILYSGAATDGNNAHAHFMLDTKGDTHTHTYSEYIILLPIPSNNGGTNAPQCYSIRVRTVPVLLHFILNVKYSYR